MMKLLNAATQLLVGAFTGLDEPEGPPPGSPPRSTSGHPLACEHNLSSVLFTVKFEGPWFLTQITLSATVGVASFLIFSYCRTRWPLLFAPRTKLKGASRFSATSPRTKLLIRSMHQASPLMKRTLTKPFSDGFSPLSERQSSRCCRLLV